MNETDNTVVPSEIDVDDVEAHGIREVMVGLSAAAVLTGGVAAVVGGDSGPGSTRATITADAPGTDISDADLAATSVDANGTSVSASDGSSAGNAAAPAAPSISRTTISPASVDEADDVAAPSFLARTTDRVDDLADDGVSWTREVREELVDAAAETYETARDTARDPRPAVREARTTANTRLQQAQSAAVRELPSSSEVVAEAISAVNNAAATVDATLEIARGTVRGLEGTASTLVASIQPSAGARIDAAEMSGWITLSVGGEEIARAQVSNGQATVSYTAPSHDLPMTVSFTGSDLLRVPPVTL